MPEPTIPTASSPGPLCLWLRLWRLLARGDRRRLVTAGVAMLLGSAVGGILPLLIGGLVDSALSGNGVSLAAAAGPLAVIAMTVIAAQGLEVLRRQLVEQVATGFERDTRSRAYHHLMRLDLDHLRHGHVGGIYGRANRSIEGAVKLVKLGAMDLFPAMLLSIASLVVAFAHNPFVACAMALVVPTGLLLARWQVASQAGVRVDIRNHKEQVDAQVVELLPALEVVRTTGADEHFTGRVQKACDGLRTTELRHHRAMSLFDAAKAINEGVWLVVTLAVAIELAAAGSISAGQVTTYVLLYAGVTTPLRELHRIIDETAESAQQTADLFGLLDEPEDEVYRAPVRRIAAVNAKKTPELSLAGVRFTHRGRANSALDGVTLQVRAGERVGLVGASGCGKSTLLKILARLHHGYEGTIRLAGRELRDIPHAELIALIGYVTQEPKLFAGSVRENITLGRKNATANQIARAARRASIHDDIMGLPHGYESIMAERGDTLSGGQRQRICLARALLCTPPVLLLDEPTSALDETSQATVQQAIDALEDVTLLMVAHRLTTLRTMDRIVVLHDGKIVEAGGYAELAMRDGHFAAMIAAQTTRAA